MRHSDQSTEQLIARLLAQHAERQVPASLDLWPVFQSRLQERRDRQHDGGRPRNWLYSRGYASAPRVAAALVLLVIVVTLSIAPFAVPAVEATVGNMLRRSGVVLIGPTQVAPPAAGRSTPVGREIATPHVLPHIGLTEAQRQVSFPIRMPSQLPDGVRFEGAVVAPNVSTDVALFFKQTDRSPGTIHIEETYGQTAGGYAFPRDKAQDLTINGHPAVYFKGSWQRDGTWNDTADVSTISWEEGVFSFMIQTSGLGITRDGLIQIAGSLR